MGDWLRCPTRFQADPHNTSLLRCFGRLKAGGKRKAPVRSLAMTSDLTSRNHSGFDGRVRL